MNASVPVESLSRMQRRMGVSVVRQLRVGLVALLVAGIVMGGGWWWRVAAVYQDRAWAQEAVSSLEQGWVSRPQHTVLQPTNVRAADVEAAMAVPESKADAASGGGDDVSAWVRWHELLVQHQLHDWQGRSVPPATLQASPSVPSDSGVVWRLEGTATFEQGVALLQSMTRSFPRLVLLWVQVQQLPNLDRLQWHLELRWSASLSALAHRWPVGGTFDTEGLVNPFALDRMTAGADSLSPVNLTNADPDRVLPQAPLQAIRLIGVLEGEKERLAVVALTETAQASGGAKSTRGSRSHRLRLGQTLGVEQARVVSIESRSVVLQSSHFTGLGRRSPRSLTLALVTPADPSEDGGPRP